MDSDDLNQVEKFLSDKQQITQEYLEQVLGFQDNQQLENNINCRYLLIKNDGNSIRQRDFLKLILQNVVVFILKYEEYQNLAGLSALEILQQTADLLRTAKSKFQTKNEKTGEPGELILFLLLESQKITQLVSKMRLKTSTEWPVLGLDAIHVQVKDGMLILHYGEAKMYREFNGAIKSAIESIEGFDEHQEDVELDLVSSNIDESKFGEHTKKILDMLDPYNPDKESLLKTHSIFLGFDWNILSNLTQKGPDLTSFIKTQYSSAQTDYSNKIKTKVGNSKVKDRSFNFFILPFTDVNEFRKSFLELW